MGTGGAGGGIKVVSMSAAKDDVVREGKVLALEESQTKRAIQSLMAEKDQTEKAEEVAKGLLNTEVP